MIDTVKLNILPILLTIVANAIVLAAAVLMDWGPLRLLAVYWLEGVAIGIVRPSRSIGRGQSNLKNYR
ncbi:MAG: hypothetical protein BWY68_00752 [bacterium ADurb.Bin400]|nr:MAG: hypothetical protein BWY68_00752 [bacterium ADurb.Bin400]